MHGTKESAQTPGRRRLRLSLGLALVAILVIACGLGIGRHYDWFVKKETRVYFVSDLVAGASLTEPEFRGFVATIQARVTPGRWAGQGGDSTITPFYAGNSLVVEASEAGHRELMDWLREERAKRGPGR